MTPAKKWILQDEQGQAIRSIHTRSDKAHLILIKNSGRLTLVEDLESLESNNIPFEKIHTFTSQSKSLKLSNGYSIKLSNENTELKSISFTSINEDDENQKPFFIYFKKSGIIHLSLILSFILMNFLFKYFNENETPPQSVKLVEIKEEKKFVSKKVVPQEKQIVKKQSIQKVTQKAPNKTKTVQSKDNTASKSLALLKSLNSNSAQLDNSKNLIKSAGSNFKGGGGVGASGAGGTPSVIGNKGLRAAQSGVGSLKSSSVSGYGQGLGGGSSQSGLKVSNQIRGKSIPGSPDDGFTDSGLDRDQIIAVINKNRGQITYCYEQALKASPTTRGTVGIKFVINPEGRVSRATISESNVNDSKLESCMVAKLRSWPFPKPVGNVNVDVFYPFHLAKLGQR